MNVNDPDRLNSDYSERQYPKIPEDPNPLFIVASEEMIRWMTEGTNPNFTPRSDCG